MHILTTAVAIFTKREDLSRAEVYNYQATMTLQLHSALKIFLITRKRMLLNEYMIYVYINGCYINKPISGIHDRTLLKVLVHFIFIRLAFYMNISEFVRLK